MPPVSLLSQLAKDRAVWFQILLRQISSRSNSLSPENLKGRSGQFTFTAIKFSDVLRGITSDLLLHVQLTAH
jgi:hypothetical protein